MPDFYIGAHAVVQRLTLITRDARRYGRGMSDHKTFPAKAGSGAAVIWVAVGIAIVLVIGIIWKLLQ